MPLLQFTAITLACIVVACGLPFTLRLAGYLLTRLGALLDREGAKLARWQQKPYAWLGELRMRQVEAQQDRWMRETLDPEEVKR